MKVSYILSPNGKKHIYSFKKGEICIVDDIEDVNGFLLHLVEEVEGTSGEEYRFLKSVKVTVTVTTK